MSRTRKQIIDEAIDLYAKKLYTELAKKFHPDLQPPEKKAEAEEKMKQVNEMYSRYQTLRKQGQ